MRSKKNLIFKYSNTKKFLLSYDLVTLLFMHIFMEWNKHNKIKNSKMFLRVWTVFADMGKEVQQLMLENILDLFVLK